MEQNCLPFYAIFASAVANSTLSASMLFLAFSPMKWMWALGMSCGSAAMLDLMPRAMAMLRADQTR